MNIPDHLHGMCAEILGIESHNATHKGLWAVILGLVPYKDGDKWCVLYGKDLQEGITGFGDTPVKAMYAFDDAMWRGEG